ncbi:MAG: DNA modification methylase [Planctomycetes bacterium]|nr:DNA modification methylase [Planctomycetota bacterium]
MDSHSTLAVEEVPIGRLFLSPSNPRRNDQAVPHVAASLRRFGWRQPVVAKPSGEVIAGNTRLKAAQSLGMERVPVVWFDGPDLEATAFAIADNKTHEFAEWDEPALAKLLHELRAEDGLEGVGFDDGEIDRLLEEFDLGEQREVEDPGEVEPPADPISQRGDVWLLGDHRLMNGDSTSEADMARLMGNDVAMLLASDPPYLVSYDGTNHPSEHHKRAGRTASEGKEVGNRNWDQYIDPESSVEFFAAWLRVALKHCIDRVPIYQWFASKRGSLVDEAWRQNGLLQHQQIIWVKTRGVLTRSMFLWSHEPCVFGWREGFMPEKDRRPPPSERTVWEIAQPDEGGRSLHPTCKPLEIFERPLRYHTLPGEIVLEPFNGSGSQLIAAERLGRKCRSMELSPGFVDAALQRWEKATGRQATLDGDGRTFAEISKERKPCGS